MNTTRWLKVLAIISLGPSLAACSATGAPPTPSASPSLPTSVPSPTPTDTPIPETPTPAGPTPIPHDLTYEQAAHLFDDPSDVPFEVRDLSSASEQEGYTI